jgi:hypothetical protein
LFIKKPSVTNAKEAYPKYQLIPSDTPSEIISDSPRRISKKLLKPPMIDKMNNILNQKLPVNLVIDFPPPC